MTRILVPRNPGILCAMGLLLTDLRADFAVTRLTVVGAEAVGDIEAAFQGLSERAEEWFAEEAVPAASRQLTRTVDMRYAGQNYELAVALPDGPVTPATLDALVEGFAAAHQRMYGFVAEGEAIQIVTFRVEATGLVAKAAFKPRPDAGPDASGAIIGRRDVWLPEAGGLVSLPDLRPSKLRRRQQDRRSGDRRADGRYHRRPAGHGGPCRTLPQPYPGIAMSMPVPSAEATASATLSVDPITVEVIGSAFSSIAEEMGEALVRASYSTNIKERRDCSTALFDIRGNTLCQAEHIPMHLGSFIGIIPHIMQAPPAVGDASPATSSSATTPIEGGGTHLPDIVLAEPIFCRWARSPPGRSTPPTTPISPTAATPTSTRKACASRRSGCTAQGELQADVQELILLNCQVPRERLSDLRAQMAANRLGVQRMKALCAKYGRDTVLAAGEALQDYAERKMRAGIAAIPDGIYRFADMLRQPGDRRRARVLGRDHGRRRRPCGCISTARRRSAPASTWSTRRCSRPSTTRSRRWSIRPSCPMPAWPARWRSRRKEGTILNCAHPAAVNGRIAACQRVVDLIHGALAQAVPERVTAAGNGACASASFIGDRSAGRAAPGSIWRRSAAASARGRPRTGWTASMST